MPQRDTKHYPRRHGWRLSGQAKTPDVVDGLK
jgi:hypothetical protein